MTIEFAAVAEAPVPAERAWAVLADYSRDAEWRGQVVTMTPSPLGPVEPGQTTAEVMRFGGRTLRNDGEVVGVGDLRFTWRTTSGVDAEGAREVRPLGPDRCRIVLRTRVRPTGPERYYAPLARLVLQRGLRKDLRSLVTIIESVR
jgi:hypothetical protein